jgi:hypothetical protein
MKLGIRHAVAVGVIAVSGIAAFACATSGPAATTAAGNDDALPAPAHIHGSPPPPPAPLRDGERFQTIGLAQPFQPAPPPGGTDEYRCFLIDPGLTEPAFIMGSQFLPQNAEIVHHAIMYMVAPSQVAHAKQIDADTPGDGWECFGGTGLSPGLSAVGDTYLGGWAPGSKETLMSTLAGYPVEAGTQIVLQIHYNLLSTRGKPGPTDQSTMRLRLMSGTNPAVVPLKALRLAAPIELPCTPQENGPLCDRNKALDDLVKRTGEEARSFVNALDLLCNGGRAPVPGVTQHCDTRVREPALVFSVGPHMHLLGRSLKVELNPGTPNAKVLLDQEAFNFDDQSTVPLAEPVKLNPGDTLRVTCTHDASLRAQLPELKVLQPRYVVWGDGTSDEMCLATLVATTRI